MNSVFKSHVERIPGLYANLINAEKFAVKPRSSWKGVKAIYIFWNEENAVHVGRTRNLQNRLGAHLSNSHYSASFVFKQARLATQIRASYRPGESRAKLFTDLDFRAEFDKQMLLLKECRLSFLEVECHVDQYLLELYAAMELKFTLEEFDTH